MKNIKRIVFMSLITIMTMNLAGCEVPDDARQKNIKQQEAISNTASNTIPVPKPSNFLAREAVAKQVKRLDERGKLFYVYLLSDNGQQIGYYVSNTRPVATCSLLTPPEEIKTSQYGTAVVKTPGIGGVYSPAPSCGGVFFFDATTDAYIEISGLNYFVSDQPLSLKSDPIRVITK